MNYSGTRLEWRNLKANWRDSLILLKEFRSPLIAFTILILGCGFLYYFLALQTIEPVSSIPEAIYIVLSLTFLQSNMDFPHTWYLQVFYFIVPILGISILAQGLADFSILFFNRRARGKEWEMAVASTYNNHIVLVGLGHLGYRVTKNLHEMKQDVVVVTLDPTADLLLNIHKMGIPIIQEDGTSENILDAAGIFKARVIILCTQNDSLNLQIALKARSMNPSIQVVIRIFDDDFAQALHNQFNFRAFSATGMAAPIFAASASDIDMTPPITIDGRPHSLARIAVNSSSTLVGKTIENIEQEFKASIVLLSHNSNKDYHPSGNIIIQEGDTLVFLTEPERINQLVYGSQK